jgi:predicted Zn-dependent protease with MMP-like domain
MLNPEHFFANLVVHLWIHIADFPADNVFDDLFTVIPISLHPCIAISAVSQHRNSVAQIEHFIKFM